ncbi:hypothetical protein EDD85DRAFT_941606 [Armillaria nabsnona]|nr:hypothetical protein EDD85DRAFT_941606 [Armillaria nabsnona]
MPNSNLPQCTHFPIQKLPPGLLAEILSYLTISEIKRLSLTFTMLNSDCFPFVFRNLWLHGDHRPAPKFFADFKDRTPTFSGGHLGNLTILPSLKLLQALELAYITIQSRSDYFGALSTIPPSVKDLRLRNNTFLDNSSFPYPVTRKIEVEWLNTETATDLSSLLEGDCPISFRSLRVASIGHPELHDIRNLVQRSPRLVNLTIFVRKSEQGQTPPFQFPISRPKHLNIVAWSGEIDILTEILLEALSDTPCALETLSLTIPHRWMANPTRDWDNVASALAQHRFPRLSVLNFRVKWMTGFEARNAGRLHVNYIGLKRRACLFVIEKAVYSSPTIARQNGRFQNVSHVLELLSFARLPTPHPNPISRFKTPVYKRRPPPWGNSSDRPPMHSKHQHSNKPPYPA